MVAKKVALGRFGRTKQLFIIGSGPDLVVLSPWYYTITVVSSAETTLEAFAALESDHSKVY